MAKIINSIAKKKSPKDNRASFKSYGHAVPKQKVKVVSRELVYEGPAFSVTKEFVHEGKKKGRRDIIRHTGSVVVLCVADGKNNEVPRILLIEQYRHAAAQVMWELPAGRIDAGENKLAAAKRELLEETGVKAAKWQHAFQFYASPGFLDETMDIYLARGLSIGEAKPEEDEQIRVHFVPLDKAVKLVMQNKIKDAKTMTAVLWFAQTNRK